MRSKMRRAVLAVVIISTQDYRLDRNLDSERCIMWRSTVQYAASPFLGLSTTSVVLQPGQKQLSKPCKFYLQQCHQRPAVQRAGPPRSHTFMNAG